MPDSKLRVSRSGGGFDSGAASDPKIDGSFLAAKVLSFLLPCSLYLTYVQGIVFVSYNYRLSLFGYPHAAEIAEAGETQNFGLLDTRAAVEWVHTNIRQFGGDPSKITLGGESVGAGEVVLLNLWGINLMPEFCPQK